MSRFYKGQLVIYANTQGYINFISEQYITICIREYQKPPEEAAHAKSITRQVCIVVPPDRWDYVLETSQHTK